MNFIARYSIVALLYSDYTENREEIKNYKNKKGELSK